MTTKYRPGIKNIAGHIFGAIFSGTCLFHMIFIDPLVVGDSAGPTGAVHTRLRIVLTYAAFLCVMLYCVYETVAMIRTRKQLERDPKVKRDMATEYGASISDIVGRILEALLCGVFLLYFVFIHPITVGNQAGKPLEGVRSFPFLSILG